MTKSEIQQRIQEFIKNSPTMIDEIVEGVGRLYYVNGNSYPSVTTVLSAVSDKTFLEEWKNRLGEEEAAKETKRAADRGSLMHHLLELHFKGELIITEELKKETAYQLYRGLKTMYLKDIDALAQEIPVWSDKLKIAGRFDLLGYYKDILSLIDFKSSTKEKNKEWIHSYFLQATFYCIMIYELTGIKIPQIVILIGTEKGLPQCFVRQLKKENYMRECLTIVNDYCKLIKN